MGEHLMAAGAFGAETAEVGWVLFVASELYYLVIGHFQQHAAADATIGAHARDGFARGVGGCLAHISFALGT